MKKIYFGFFAIGLFFSSLAMAVTPQDAVSQINENAKQVLSILVKANGKNNQQVRKEAENYAVPYFDFERMTALAIGAPWRNATATQKQQLTNEFKNLLIRTYSGALLEFKDAQVEVKNNPIINKNGKEIIVQVDMKNDSNSNQPVRMSYTTYYSGNKYKVYNVTIEGSSLVTVYRNQFNELIGRSGIDGLIEDLRKKNSGKS